MDINISHDKLYDERHVDVMTGIKGIHTRLDQLNGRQRSAEIAIAVLQWGYGLGAVIAVSYFYYAFDLVAKR